MEICFPAQTLSLVQVFAPCCTAPSLAYFRASVWALRVVEEAQRRMPEEAGELEHRRERLQRKVERRRTLRPVQLEAPI